MNTPTLRSPLLVLGFVMALLIGNGLLSASISAQATEPAPLTMRFEEPYYAVRTINEETTVDYSFNIIVSDEDAELACDPPPGSLFPRGATLVTCTATRSDQTVEGSFYVLVSSTAGNETDIEIYTIAQSPEDVVEAAQVVYTVELRNNGLSRATGIVVSGTLPPQVELVRADPNCNTAALPAIRCVLPELLTGRREGFPIEVKIKPGVTGAIFLTMTAEITGGETDLFADNNSFTRRTDVRTLGFGSNAVYLPFLQR